MHLGPQDLECQRVLKPLSPLKLLFLRTVLGPFDAAKGFAKDIDQKRKLKPFGESCWNLSNPTLLEIQQRCSIGSCALKLAGGSRIRALSYSVMATCLLCIRHATARKNMEKPSPKMNPRGPSQSTSGKITKGRSPGFQAWTLGGIVGIVPHIHGIRTSYGRWSMFQGKATGDHRAVGTVWWGKGVAYLKCNIRPHLVSEFQ